MAVSKIQKTTNYRMFTRSDDNRPTDPKKHKKLKESMQEYGFLKCFPIVVKRRGSVLFVKDGQHRLMFAEELGLPVWWVEEELDFDIAVINCTSRTWTLKDYAEKHALNGLGDYQEGLDFAANHRLPLGTAFALLAGTTSFTNCNDEFIDGTFTVKDRDWADDVASLYVSMTQLSGALKNARFIAACMGVCRVKDFSVKRMLECARRRRDMLVPYSTKDAYLSMLDDVYNYGRQQKTPLKFNAEAAMRERNVATKGKNGSSDAKADEAA